MIAQPTAMARQSNTTYIRYSCNGSIEFECFLVGGIDLLLTFGSLFSLEQNIIHTSLSRGTFI